jgi:hypothetical protein
MVTADVVDAYQPFQAMHAVLDIARLPILNAAGQEAVVKGMRIFAERYDKRLAALNPGRDLSGLFRISIDPALASGERVLAGEVIPFGEFLGSGYDMDRDAIRLFSYSEGARSSDVFEGLARALLDPPYGLRRPSAPWAAERFSAAYGVHEAAWMRDVLRAFCREVLAVEDPKHTAHLEVRRWPTDWSNYFAAGHEWWGAFFWTIEDTKNGWVTVIAASSTD